jgi:hypothetical protein
MLHLAACQSPHAQCQFLQQAMTRNGASGASKELPGAEQKLPGQDKFLSALPRPPAGPYAVEKLTHLKMAEKTLHQEALQTTFSVS